MLIVDRREGVRLDACNVVICESVSGKAVLLPHNGLMCEMHQKHVSFF